MESVTGIAGAVYGWESPIKLVILTSIAAMWLVVACGPGHAEVDECATNNGGCDDLTTCTHNPDAPPTCGTCPDGYTGDGYTGCADIDECATNNGGCGDPDYWTCTNNAGAAPTCTESGQQEHPCEDRGPCVESRRLANGSCAYGFAPEATPCDDGDPCTTDDRCEAGECKGSDYVSDGKVLGSLGSFGASPVDGSWMEGIAQFVAPDRIVFAESTDGADLRLSLVAVETNCLVLLDQASSRLRVDRWGATHLYWYFEFSTFIVPLAVNRFAIVASDALNPVGPPGIEVFEVVDDRLVSRSWTPLPGDLQHGLRAFGVVGRDDFLLLCGSVPLGSLVFRVYRMDPVTLAFTQAHETYGPDCNDLALSADGRQIYVAGGGKGQQVDISDLSDFGQPVEVVNDQYWKQVKATDRYVAFLSLGVALD